MINMIICLSLLIYHTEKLRFWRKSYSSEVQSFFNNSLSKALTVWAPRFAPPHLSLFSSTHAPMVSPVFLSSCSWLQYFRTFHFPNTFSHQLFIQFLHVNAKIFSFCILLTASCLGPYFSKCIFKMMCCSEHWAPAPVSLYMSEFYWDICISDSDNTCQRSRLTKTTTFIKQLLWDK